MRKILTQMGRRLTIFEHDVSLIEHDESVEVKEFLMLEGVDDAAD